MRGVITAPKKVITGAFSVIFSFLREIELTRADITVETLEGSALGHDKDSFTGSGANYQILCYIPDERAGRSRISVNKDGVSVQSVEVEYDTVRTITPIWGTPFKRNGKVEIPLTLSDAVTGLRKRNFAVSQPIRYQLYGSGTDYQFVVVPQNGVGSFSVTVAGSVLKSSGLDAVIKKTQIEVNI